MKSRIQRGSFVLGVVLFFAELVAMAGTPKTVLNGAGATFPYPLYSKWFSDFQKLDASAEINYQSIGSGGGIRQLLDKTVDFGASDAPMTDEQLSKSAVPIFHIPTVLGAVTVTYNLPEIKTELKLTSEVLAAIFMGKITTWSDPQIAKLNPTAKLPKDQQIFVVHRSDGSGTTAVFTDYLSKVSPEWKTAVGAGPAVKWPTGLGGKGNEGVSGLLKQTPGAIGYIELTYAESNHLPVASLKNKAGAFIKPSPKSVTAAAQGAVAAMPSDFRVSITDSDGKGAYPISAFTYILVYKKMDPTKGPALVKFLNWALKDGQKSAETLSYAPLPTSLVGKVKKTVEQIQTKD